MGKVHMLPAQSPLLMPALTLETRLEEIGWCSRGYASVFWKPSRAFNIGAGKLRRGGEPVAAADDDKPD